jgi:hypothetical protein
MRAKPNAGAAGMHFRRAAYFTPLGKWATSPMPNAGLTSKNHGNLPAAGLLSG